MSNSSHVGDEGCRLVEYLLSESAMGLVLVFAAQHGGAVPLGLPVRDLGYRTLPQRQADRWVVAARCALEGSMLGAAVVVAPRSGLVAPAAG